MSDEIVPDGGSHLPGSPPSGATADAVPGGGAQEPGVPSPGAVPPELAQRLAALQRAIPATTRAVHDFLGDIVAATERFTEAVAAIAAQQAAD